MLLKIIYSTANRIQVFKSALGKIRANGISSFLSQSDRLLRRLWWPLNDILPVGIVVFDFQQAFSIVRFEDFELRTEMHLNALIKLQVFSRAATIRVIWILKSAK